MTRVALYREFATRIASEGQEVRVEHMTVFGWKVRRHIMDAGAKVVTYAAADIPRTRVPNRAMYVKGLATVSINGTAGEDRVPGLYTDERPHYPAGECVVTALEETEFWCFNFFENGRAFPALDPVRIAAGGILALSAGQLLFVMRGTAGDAVGPCTYVPGAEESLTVSEDLYAFIVAEAKL